MDDFFSGVEYRNLYFIQGRRMRICFILWVTLTSWITTAAAQGLQSSCNVSLTGSGNILSPNYPLEYPNSINCTWRLLSSSTATSIRLKFNNFITESNLDLLRIYDEKGIVTLFSGSVFPPILSLGRTALLEFTTDSSVTRQGFNASFTSFDITNLTQCNTSDSYWCANSRRCIRRSWRCDNLVDCVQGEDELGCATTATTTPPCGGTVVGSGQIQSPNYPRNYPNNAHCIWRLFSNPNGTVIKMQFTSFYMEQNYDYVTVYDTSVSKRYTGGMSPFVLLLGREARIEFHSDGSATMQGFAAQFVSVNVSTQNQCLMSGSFWCPSNQKCISMTWRCDGYPDCTLREDEYLCPATTISTTTTFSSQSDCLRSGRFWCSRSSQCVPASYRCDNYNDCTYGEDEANCSNVLQQQCQQNQRFWCGTSKQCINSLWKCDHTNDCTYGEDEQGCLYLTTGTITGIVAGCVCGVVLLVLLVVGLLRAMTVRRLRSTIPRSNNYLQTTARPSATVYSTPATYASQFGAPNRQADGLQGTGVVPMDQYAPPSYDATINAYATGQYAYPPGQSGVAHPPSNAPSAAPPTH